MSTDKYPPLPEPERNPPDPADIIAGALGTSRAHAYDLMREACAAAQPAAALTDDEIFLAYTAATGKTLPTLGPSRNDLIAISRAVIAAHEAKKGGEAMLPEPFGYFKSKPFGWTDCAPDAEGAKALYEHPAPERNDSPDSTGLAVVDTRYHWRPIDADTPRGAKLQLINRAAGVATYGALGTDPGHWTHWAPLPTFEDRT